MENFSRKRAKHRLKKRKKEIAFKKKIGERKILKNPKFKVKK